MPDAPGALVKAINSNPWKITGMHPVVVSLSTVRVVANPNES